MNANEQIAPLTERMFLFLEEGDWDKANKYCERILDKDPRNQKAYLGKLMIDYRVSRKSDLSNLKKDFEQNINYQRIVRFGDPEFVQEIQQYLGQVKANIRKKEFASQQHKQKKSNHFISLIPFSILFIIIIAILCVKLLPREDNYDYEIFPQPEVIEYYELEYKSILVKVPKSDDYTLEISEDDIINITGEFLSINEFLSCLDAPEGKKFYAKGGFASSNGFVSFLIKDRINVKTFYYNGDKGRSETLDLVFCGYGEKYKAMYVNQSGSNAPMSYTGNRSGMLSVLIDNEWKNNVSFDLGETVIIGQYHDDETEANPTQIQITVSRK